MSEPHQASFVLPRRGAWGSQTTIPGPSYESFTARFGHAFPAPQFLTSDLGTTAVYSLLPPSGEPAKRHVLLIHGANTPALGLLALARELQALDASAHVVLFDLWGHGLSSTPLAPHTAQIFHFQIFQVLNFMRWTGEGTDVHILGYSFGACMAARFAVHNPWAARSVALLAPAGILDKAQLSARMRELLDDGTGSRDAEAADCVLEWLEGGPLIVPADWAERVQAGQVVAEAFRAWELEEHKGYALSVLSMFREDNVYGCEDSFREFAGLSLKKVVVLGELDGVCSKSQLVDLGFDNVQVVEKANHGVVRSAAVEVARHVHRLWTEQS